MTSTVAFGYLDYTYFYFTDAYLKSKNLKFAMVLNHQKMQMELWLAGRTREIQKKYWQLMKNTRWIHGAEEMPEYAVLEVVLENRIDFGDKEHMTQNIIGRAVALVLEIEEYLKSLDISFVPERENSMEEIQCLKEYHPNQL